MTRNTNTNIPLEEQPEEDLGRKPYVAGKSYEDLGTREFLHGGSDGGTYQAMMRRKAYKYSAPEQLQHSQFKKPYMGDEFIEMEHFGDNLLYLGFIPWEITLDIELPPGETAGTTGAAGRCTVGCDISINAHEWNEDCTELTIAFRSEYNEDEDRFSSGNKYLLTSNHPAERSDGLSYYTGDLPQGFLFKSIPSGKTITAKFFQNLKIWCPSSSIDCSAEFEITPDCCSLIIDEDNSDETVTLADPGDPTLGIITAIGGDGNYTWSVLGTGVAMTSAITTLPTNTVECDDATSCGTARVSVTSCGVTVEWDIRIIGNSSGWNVAATQTCDPGNFADCPVTLANILQSESGGNLLFRGTNGRWHLREEWTRDSYTGPCSPPYSDEHYRWNQAFTDLPDGVVPDLLSFGANHDNCSCAGAAMYSCPATNSANCGPGTSLLKWFLQDRPLQAGGGITLYEWTC